VDVRDHDDRALVGDEEAHASLRERAPILVQQRRGGVGEEASLLGDGGFFMFINLYL